jgi:3-dehydroquinate dehydratase-2
MTHLRIRLLHGPNLNLLGRREVAIYGATSLDEVNAKMRRVGEELDCTVEAFQSNHEGELIDAIQQSDGFDGFVVNPGGLGHTSVALRDAFLAVDVPCVEVHCSNTAAREPFRRTSLLTDVAVGLVMGFSAESYEWGLRALVAHLRRTPAEESA